MLKNHVLVFMFHPFRATNKNETAISCGTVVSNGWGGRVPLGTLYGFQMSQTDGGGFQGRVPPPEFEMMSELRSQYTRSIIYFVVGH